MDWKIRSEMALGKENVARLAEKTVAVVGLGGVGGYVAEVLARSGVGGLLLVDKDCISESNINRQLIATTENVGKPKAGEWKKRVETINPACKAIALDMFYLPESRDEFFKFCMDFIADAVDTVTAKLDLIEQANARKIPIISSMGFGNKLDPEKIRITDISKTSVCPLARVMRRELKKRGITNLPVAFSDEEAIEPFFSEESGETRKISPASVAWIPSVAGIMLGGYIVKRLISED